LRAESDKKGEDKVSCEETPGKGFPPWWRLSGDRYRKGSEGRERATEDASSDPWPVKTRKGRTLHEDGSFTTLPDPRAGPADSVVGSLKYIIKIFYSYFNRLQGFVCPVSLIKCKNFVLII
jgi:hypothetical protein